MGYFIEKDNIRLHRSTFGNDKKGGQAQTQSKCRKLLKIASSNFIASRGTKSFLLRKVGLSKVKKFVQGHITCLCQSGGKKTEILALCQWSSQSRPLRVLTVLWRSISWTGFGRPHYNVIELSSSLTINGRLLEKEHKIVQVKQIARSIQRLTAKETMKTEDMSTAL